MSKSINMNKKIAVLGCGYWGTIVINCLKKLNLFKFIYIYDTDINRVKIISNQFILSNLVFSFHFISSILSLLFQIQMSNF